MATHGALKIPMLIQIYFVSGEACDRCAWSPRFTLFWMLALGCWRPKIGDAGVDFQDGMLTRLDWKFTDAMILFVKTFDKTKF